LSNPNLVLLPHSGRDGCDSRMWSELTKAAVKGCRDTGTSASHLRICTLACQPFHPAEVGVVDAHANEAAASPEEPKRLGPAQRHAASAVVPVGEGFSAH
jgi:hypothetical protein